ncbi:lipase member K-like [Acropora millepora]|uniref:lipase member K-like n=1 Tax=Acropora millepora TaxID=45264 RepID=UPI001CF5F1D5|nr:lipase member K-like [Acropora millepora]
MYWAEISLIALSCFVLSNAKFLSSNQKVSIDPDIGRNVTEIIASRGYTYEEHHVTTQDGFILGLQRIPRGRGETNGIKHKPIVFLQHGILADASNWVLGSSRESLGYILADNGFDVWLGNVRGNDYSMRHVKYKPSQSVFWNWSWQEMADYDLPAMINYVLHVTGKKQLFYVGHSQGTMIAFNGFSNNLALGNKVKAFFALAPVYTLNNTTKVVKGLAEIMWSIVKKFNPNLNFDTLPGDFFKSLVKLGYCANAISERICEYLSGSVFGMDSKNIDKSRGPVYLAHFGEGTSFKNMVHFSQIIVEGKCQMFDYGPTGNEKHYNQTSPPLCRVQNMRTPTLMFVGGNDGLGDPSDNKALEPQIKNLVHYEVIPGWNHVDFLYGKDAHSLLYSKLVSYMKSRRLLRSYNAKFIE